MPDLSLESVHAFWHEYDSKILYRIVCSLEQTETWVTTNPTIDNLVHDLGDILDSSTSVEYLSQETMITLLTSIKFTQSLRIMHAIETKTPGFVSGLLVWAQEQSQAPENSPCKIFLKRNVIFERLQLLSRIFSQERTNLITKAQEYTSD
jgi:intracellular multiplication protein IcmW